MKKIFLGGTCNNSTWRDELIPLLKGEDGTKAKLSYFNPVVEDWTSECQEEELKQRESCDICLYVITSDMTGVYSIAEIIDDSNKRPGKTVFAYLSEGFSKGQCMSLEMVGEMVRRNGGMWISGMLDSEDFDYITTEDHITKIAQVLHEL